MLRASFINPFSALQSVSHTDLLTWACQRWISGNHKPFFQTFLILHCSASCKHILLYCALYLCYLPVMPKRIWKYASSHAKLNLGLSVNLFMPFEDKQAKSWREWSVHLLIFSGFGGGMQFFTNESLLVVHKVSFFSLFFPFWCHINSKKPLS